MNDAGRVRAPDPTADGSWPADTEYGTRWNDSGTAPPRPQIDRANTTVRASFFDGADAFERLRDFMALCPKGTSLQISGSELRFSYPNAQEGPA